MKIYTLKPRQHQMKSIYLRSKSGINKKLKSIRLQNEPQDLIFNWDINLAEVYMNPQLIKDQEEFIFPDITNFSEDILLFSELAVKSLKDVDFLHCEFLPTKSHFNSYFILNTKLIIDALDYNNSYISYDKNIDEDYITSISVYNFNATALRDILLFRLPINCSASVSNFYISEKFKNIIESSNLKVDLEILLVWDSENSDYFDERYKTNEDFYRVKDKLKKDKNIQKPQKIEFKNLSNTIEQKISAQEYEKIKSMIQIAQEFIDKPLNSSHSEVSSTNVVSNIQEILEKLQSQNLSRETREHHAIELGLFWGEQVVQSYGWHWAKIEDEFAIVSPDASFYIFPVAFIFKFLDGSKQAVTALLLFNMLSTPQKEIELGSYLRIE